MPLVVLPSPFSTRPQHVSAGSACTRQGHASLLMSELVIFFHLCSWLRLAGAVRALDGNEDVTPLQRRSDELSAAVARLTTPLDALIEGQ